MLGELVLGPVRRQVHFTSLQSQISLLTIAVVHMDLQCLLSRNRLYQ